MDPGTKLGILVGGAGLVATLVWLAARKLLGRPPERDDSADGGLPPM